MAPNRRNFYRLLHVQADAPIEVIKASYRALMTTHHPDVGGDHEAAVLLNEAYAVLSDADRRADYDRRRAAKMTGRPAADSRATTPPPRKADGPVCAFCRLPRPTVIHTDSRCVRCRAPLAAIRRTGDANRQTERRAMPRVSKSDWGLLHIDWPSQILDVRMRDVSLDGISVYCGVPLPVGRTIRVVGATLDVVADIVTVRRVANVHTLHARLVTALFASPVGGFVSQTA